MKTKRDILIALVMMLIGVVLIFPSKSYCSFKLDRENIYDDGDIALFSDKKFQEILTRQNSCTIYMTDFIFAEPLNGDYLVQLKLIFKSSYPGSSNQETNSEYVLLFSGLAPPVADPATLRALSSASSESRFAAPLLTSLLNACSSSILAELPSFAIDLTLAPRVLNLEDPESPFKTDMLKGDVILPTTPPE